MEKNIAEGEQRIAENKKKLEDKEKDLIKSKKQIISNLLKANLSLEQIVEVTGFSKDEIDELMN